MPRIQRAGRTIHHITSGAFTGVGDFPLPVMVIPSGSHAETLQVFGLLFDPSFEGLPAKFNVLFELVSFDHKTDC